MSKTNLTADRVTVKEAAKRLGLYEDTVRQGLRSNTFPVGCAIRTSTGRYVYVIPRTAFEIFIRTGKCSVDTLMEAMA